MPTHGHSVLNWLEDTPSPIIDCGHLKLWQEVRSTELIFATGTRLLVHTRLLQPINAVTISTKLSLQQKKASADSTFSELFLELRDGCNLTQSPDEFAASHALFPLERLKIFYD